MNFRPRCWKSFLMRPCLRMLRRVKSKLSFGWAFYGKSRLQHYLLQLDLGWIKVWWWYEFQEFYESKRENSFAIIFIFLYLLSLGFTQKIILKLIFIYRIIPKLELTFILLLIFTNHTVAWTDNQTRTHTHGCTHSSRCKETKVCSLWCKQTGEPTWCTMVTSLASML